MSWWSTLCGCLAKSGPAGGGQESHAAPVGGRRNDQLGREPPLQDPPIVPSSSYQPETSASSPAPGPPQHPGDPRTPQLAASPRASVVHVRAAFLPSDADDQAAGVGSSAPSAPEGPAVEAPLSSPRPAAATATASGSASVSVDAPLPTNSASYHFMNNHSLHPSMNDDNNRHYAFNVPLASMVDAAALAVATVARINPMPSRSLSNYHGTASTVSAIAYSRPSSTPRHPGELPAQAILDESSTVSISSSDDNDDGLPSPTMPGRGHLGPGGYVDRGFPSTPREAQRQNAEEAAFIRGTLAALKQATLAGFEETGETEVLPGLPRVWFNQSSHRGLAGVMASAAGGAAASSQGGGGGGAPKASLALNPTVHEANLAALFSGAAAAAAVGGAFHALIPVQHPTASPGAAGGGSGMPYSGHQNHSGRGSLLSERISFSGPASSLMAAAPSSETMVTAEGPTAAGGGEGALPRGGSGSPLVRSPFALLPPSSNAANPAQQHSPVSPAQHAVPRYADVLQHIFARAMAAQQQLRQQMLLQQQQPQQQRVLQPDTPLPGQQQQPLDTLRLLPQWTGQQQLLQSVMEDAGEEEPPTQRLLLGVQQPTQPSPPQQPQPELHGSGAVQGVSEERAEALNVAARHASEAMTAGQREAAAVLAPAGTAESTPAEGGESRRGGPSPSLKSPDGGGGSSSGAASTARVLAPAEGAAVVAVAASAALQPQPHSQQNASVMAVQDVRGRQSAALQGGEPHVAAGAVAAEAPAGDRGGRALPLADNDTVASNPLSHFSDSLGIAATLHGVVAGGEGVHVEDDVPTVTLSAALESESGSRPLPAAATAPEAEVAAFAQQLGNEQKKVLAQLVREKWSPFSFPLLAAPPVVAPALGGAGGPHASTGSGPGSPFGGGGGLGIMFGAAFGGGGGAAAAAMMQPVMPSHTSPPPGTLGQGARWSPPNIHYGDGSITPCMLDSMAQSQGGGAAAAAVQPHCVSGCDGSSIFAPSQSGSIRSNSGWPPTSLAARCRQGSSSDRPSGGNSRSGPVTASSGGGGGVSDLTQSLPPSSQRVSYSSSIAGKWAGGFAYTPALTPLPAPPLPVLVQQQQQTPALLPQTPRLLQPQSLAASSDAPASEPPPPQPPAYLHQEPTAPAAQAGTQLRQHEQGSGQGSGQGPGLSRGLGMDIYHADPWIPSPALADVGASPVTGVDAAEELSPAEAAAGLSGADMRYVESLVQRKWSPFFDLAASLGPLLPPMPSASASGGVPPPGGPWHHHLQPHPYPNQHHLHHHHQKQEVVAGFHHSAVQGSAGSGEQQHRQAGVVSPFASPSPWSAPQQRPGVAPCAERGPPPSPFVHPTALPASAQLMPRSSGIIEPGTAATASADPTRAPRRLVWRGREVEAGAPAMGQEGDAAATLANVAATAGEMRNDGAGGAVLPPELHGVSGANAGGSAGDGDGGAALPTVLPTVRPEEPTAMCSFSEGLIDVGDAAGAASGGAEGSDVVGVIVGDERSGSELDPVVHTAADPGVEQRAKE